MVKPILHHEFYNLPTLTIARELIGARLGRVLEGRKLVGLITETEAYIGEEDQACHAKAGRTSRTQIMYGPPGHAYVYFTYGNHWMLNVVTEKEDFPAAVLIRAIQPVEGAELMSARRSGRDTFGPGKLTQAMGITKSENTLDLTEANSNLWIEAGVSVPDQSVTIGPRVGLNTVPEPWLSKPWRFLVKGWKLNI
ncbi:MAG: DNA-3-methyladenine glycosylase [Anaerolineae bacterium]|nr:DNA-3-methyladenine glycosylase [Anaerolineae bacterium]MDK1081026.1 DNA-3-methyladenine glycosylase [Anaerolineae bacterium]MDK1117456.1 DNA-3-methyladenine glycosylase [Anaerolineae bacterium]